MRAKNLSLRMALASLLVFPYVWFATPLKAQGLDISSARAQESARRLDELDRDADVRQTGDNVLADPLARRELPPAGGPTVLLQRVVFAPASAFLSAGELDEIAARYTGNSVDFRQISALVRDVNDLYAEKGVVTAAAILPPQDLAGGVLEVRLVEGQLGSVGIVGERQSSDEFILNRVRLSKGQTVDIPTASRDIAYFNATNRANLRLLLQPGASFGLTDLTLGVTEPPAQQLQFFLDNTGAESTGEQQISSIYRRYGLAGLDDTFLAYAALTDGSKSLTLRYDLPVTTIGTRLAGSYTLSDVEVTHGPASDLGIEGNSESVSLTLTQPFIANDTWLLEGVASVFAGSSETDASGIPLVDSETDKLSFGLSFSYTNDRAFVTGQLLSVRADTKDKIIDTSDDFDFVVGSLRGTYQINDTWRLIGNTSFQRSDEVLVPGDLLFQIGGPTTVRGYPSDGIAGDEGFYANLEVRHRSTFQGLPTDAYAFVDFGEVESTFPSKTNLLSTGVGIDRAFSDRLSLNLSVAVPIEDAVPNQSSLVVSAVISIIAF